MKRIDVYSIEQLEQLRNLSGNESFFLKIHSDFSYGKIDAISLKAFQGQFMIRFDEEGSYFYKVYGKDERKILYFFEDYQKANIDFFSHSVSFLYLEKKKDYYVRNSLEFQKAVHQSFTGKKIIHLQDDIVVPNEVVSFLTIDGNHHRLYCKKKMEQNLDIQNTEIILVDEIVFVRRKEDLLSLEKFTNETVVVSFKNSIVLESFSAISLRNFVGKMYLLGNDHSISQCRIMGNTKCLGLFSVIHPYGSLSFFKLHLKHNEYFGEHAIFMGGFLAKRIRVDQNYYSPMGTVSIQNCSIEDCLFTSSSVISIHPFIGYAEENTEIIDSTVKNLTQFSLASGKQKAIEEDSVIYSEFSRERGVQYLADYSLKRRL